MSRRSIRTFFKSLTSRSIIGEEEKSDEFKYQYEKSQDGYHEVCAMKFSFWQVLVEQYEDNMLEQHDQMVNKKCAPQNQSRHDWEKKTFNAIERLCSANSGHLPWTLAWQIYAITPNDINGSCNSWTPPTPKSKETLNSPGIRLPGTFCQGCCQRNSGTRNPSGSVSGTNFERVSPESGTKLPIHYFHNLEYVLQKMQHCSLNIAGKKNLRSFVISGHFDVCQFIIETTASLHVNDPFTPKRFAPQNHSHHWCNTNSGHLPWNHCLTKAPRNLSSTCINEELQLVIGRPQSIETPLNSFKKRSHIFKSLLAPTVRMILYYDFTNPTG